MKTLHRVKGIHQDLVVTREGKKITLWTPPGIRHTVMDLERPFLPGLEYARNTLLALAFTPGAQSFLMLGLGGGSIAAMIGAARPSASIDAVEIDPAVPELARRFFLAGGSPRLRIHVNDAAAYLDESDRQYDVIILDAYSGDVLPAQCSTRRFFRQARDRLAANGVLIVNWMPGDKERYRRVLAKIEESVGSVWVLRGTRSRNSLLFAPVRPSSRRELLEEAERIGREIPFGNEIVRSARRLKLSTAGS